MRSSEMSVAIDVDDADPRDPAARCDRCGAQGTIARAVQHTAEPLVLRYCGPCWPAAQEELDARQREENERWREVVRKERPLRHLPRRRRGVVPRARGTTHAASWHS